MRDRQQRHRHRQMQGDRAHMRRGSGFRHKIFVLFSAFVLFLFFLFFVFCLLFPCIVYSSGPSIFTLFTLIFLSAVPFVLCYMPCSSSSFSLPALRLAICLIVGVLVFPFTFSVMCAEAAEM